MRALGEGEVEAVLTALLPRRETAMTSDGIAELERVFGDDGEMPAMRLSWCEPSAISEFSSQRFVLPTWSHDWDETSSSP
jgi:hypothetical protein